MLRSLLAFSLSASCLLAQNYFSAALDGAQETPPVATTARGWGVVRHDPATNNVRIFVFNEGLSGAPTGAHLHLGPVGGAGGIILPLVAAGPNEWTGVGVLTAPQAAALVAGSTYLNVHTPANPGGEIRGQVVTSVSSRFTGVLSGAQQVPPVASAGTGTAVAYLHEPENRIVYMVQTSGLAVVSAAHFHQGPAGGNGPVVIDFGAGNGTYCGVSNRLTAAQVAAWKANGFYANIHTPANPGGEIRAQMLADVGDHFVAEIDGAHEVPVNPSPALGGANLVLKVGGTLSLTGGFSGLSGPPTGAHVHFAPVGVNGPIVFPLTVAGSSLSATFTPSAADLVNLRAGNWYVNIHTAANPGGEIRGQLVPAALPATFGSGCVGSNGVRPQAGATGFASVGGAMAFDLYGALPGSIALFAFGTSRDTASGVIPLPVELPALGLAAPKCYLLVDPTTLVTVGLDARGCGTLPLALPFLPTLRGLSFYSQWFAFDPLANPSAFVASNALTITVK